MAKELFENFEGFLDKDDDLLNNLEDDNDDIIEMDLSEYDDDNDDNKIKDQKKDDEDDDTKKDEKKDDDTDDDLILEETTDEDDDENNDDKTEETDDDTTPSDDKSSSSSLFKILAQSLAEEGVISSLEDDQEVTSAKDLINIFQKELDSSIDSYKESLPPIVKNIIDNYEDGMDLEKIIKLKSEAQSYSKIDGEKLAENKSLMRKLILDDLKARGYSEEDAVEATDDVFDLGKEEVRAKKALTALKKRQENAEESERLAAKQRIKDAEQAQIKAQQSMKKAIESTDDFGGVKISKKIQNEVYDSLYKVADTIEGRPVNVMGKARNEDPVAFDKNIALVWNLTKGFKDWSLFSKSSKKSALDQLEQEAAKATQNVKPGQVKRRMNTSKNEQPGAAFENLNI